MSKRAKEVSKFDTFDLLLNICQVLATFNNCSPFTFEMVQANVYVETGQKASYCDVEVLNRDSITAPLGFPSMIYVV